MAATKAAMPGFIECFLSAVRCGFLHVAYTCEFLQVFAKRARLSTVGPKIVDLDEDQPLEAMLDQRAYLGLSPGDGLRKLVG
jgi:hypothetical protein